MRKRVILNILYYAVPAVAVFVFLGYHRPWLMTAREDGQLWLLGSDYLAERLSEPGGCARYMAEAIVQTYSHVALGAVVTAVLFAAMLWLWWTVVNRIWRYYRHADGPLWLRVVALAVLAALWLTLLDINVQMTLPVSVAVVLALTLLVPQQGRRAYPTVLLLMLPGWWLAGPVVVLLPLLTPWASIPHFSDQGQSVALRTLSPLIPIALLAVAIWVYAPRSQRPVRSLLAGIDYVNGQTNMVGTAEEQQYCFLVQRHLWNRILTAAEQHPPQSRACQYAVMLAEWKLLHTREQELLQALHDTWGALSSCAASLLMSEVYLQLGWLHMSQRAAHDAMVSYPNYNNSGRALKRLVEVNLVTGQYDLVRKYTAILEKAPFCRDWAREARQLADHPEQMEHHANLMRLKAAYRETPDGVFY